MRVVESINLSNLPAGCELIKVHGDLEGIPSSGYAVMKRDESSSVVLSASENPIQALALASSSKPWEPTGLLATLKAPRKPREVGGGTMLELLRHLIAFTRGNRPEHWKSLGPGWLSEFAVRLGMGRQAGLSTAMMRILAEENATAIWVVPNFRCAEHLQVMAKAQGTTRIGFIVAESVTATILAETEPAYVVLEGAPYLRLPGWFRSHAGKHVPDSCVMVELG